MFKGEGITSIKVNLIANTSAHNKVKFLFIILKSFVFVTDGWKEIFEYSPITFEFVPALINNVKIKTMSKKKGEIMFLNNTGFKSDAIL